jgi:hypothetical protein
MTVDEIIGGLVFFSIFACLGMVLLGVMNHQINRIEYVLNKEDKYVN